MPSIAIRKRMDNDKPMMEPNRDLIGTEGSILNPVVNIAQQRR